MVRQQLFTFSKKALDVEYTVFSISFEGMADSSFSSLEACGRAFSERVRALSDNGESHYLVSFCFNKRKNSGVHEVKLDERTIIEAIV